MRVHLYRCIRTIVLLTAGITFLLHLLGVRHGRRASLRHGETRATLEQKEVDSVPPPGVDEEIVIDWKRGVKRVEKKSPKVRSKSESSLLTEMLQVNPWDVPEVFRCAHSHYNAKYRDRTACAEQIHPPNDTKPYNLTIWTQDYDLATIQDIRFLLEPLGVRFLEKSLSPYCSMLEVCGTNLRLVNVHNGMDMPSDVANQFHAEYIKDRELLSADAFLCVQPPAMCELFMPFGKSLIIFVGSRYELGRWSPERYESWNTNLKVIENDPYNMVSATNQYDIEYLRFYTKLEPTVLPHYCGYITHSYNPTETSFLIYHFKAPVFNMYFDSEFGSCTRTENISVSIKRMDGMHIDQTQESLVKYPGIVLIPDQVSSIRMTELYRLNIPLFAPSFELLTKWHMRFQIVRGRTWRHVTSQIPGSLDMRKAGLLSMPNPNDEKNIGSVGFWLQFADIYTWPHVVYFNSIKDLVRKIQKNRASGRLIKLSKKMRVFNEVTKLNIKRVWLNTLERIQKKRDRMLRNGVI